MLRKVEPLEQAHVITQGSPMVGAVNLTVIHDDVKIWEIQTITTNLNVRYVEQFGSNQNLFLLFTATPTSRRKYEGEQTPETTVVKLELPAGERWNVIVQPRKYVTQIVAYQAS